MRMIADFAGSFATTMFGGALWFSLSRWLEFIPSWTLILLMVALSFVGFLVWVVLDFILFFRSPEPKRQGRD